MCYAKPGPRCSPHAKETMQKAASEVFATLNSVQLEAYNGNEVSGLQAQLNNQLIRREDTLKKFDSISAEIIGLRALSLSLTGKTHTAVSPKDHALIMTALNQEGITQGNATQRFNEFLAKAPQQSINDYANNFGVQQSVARELYAIKFATQISERKAEAVKTTLEKEIIPSVQNLAHTIIAKKVATVRRMANSQIKTANPKLGDFNKAEKEYHLTSGYRSVLKDEANKARERGNFTTSNMLFNEAAKLDAEYDYKYGAWLAVHKKGIEAIL